MAKTCAKAGKCARYEIHATNDRHKKGKTTGHAPHWALAKHCSTLTKH
jgi:hypothetical protein